MKKKRDANFELLRILCMIMIVTLHFFLHSAIKQLTVLNSNFVFTWTFEAISYVAVDCFVLLTGYFSIDSLFNRKRIIPIIILTEFYSYLFLIIELIINRKNISISALIMSMFPIISGHYWFITVYILLCLFIPYINKLFSILSNKQFDVLLIFLVLCFSVIPTFFPFSDINIGLNGGTNLIWFFILYLTGIWIRKNNFKVRVIRLVFVYMASLWITVITKISILIVFHRTQGGAVFYHHNSFFVYISSICLLLLFSKLKIKNYSIEKMILSVSPLCLGVYIIHENIFIKNKLWNKVISIQNLNSLMWPIFACLTIISIFIFCLVTEQVRRLIFEKVSINTKIIYITERWVSILNNTLDSRWRRK